MIKKSLLIGIVLFIMSCQNINPPNPPVAEIIPTKIPATAKDTLIDNYYWMKDRKNPKVIEYLKAENAYTDAVMQHTQQLQEKLYQEMVGRLKETDFEINIKNINI